MCPSSHILGQGVIVLWSDSGTISTLRKRKIKRPTSQTPLDSTFFPILSQPHRAFVLALFRSILHKTVKTKHFHDPALHQSLLLTRLHLHLLAQIAASCPRKPAPRWTRRFLEDFEKITWDEYDERRTTRPTDLSL
jgi:hypothetical protein